MPPSSPSVATLVAHHLAKSYAGVPILHDIDLVVGPQHRIGVIGPNGVGKTTLLRLLARLDVPDSGRIVLSPPSATVGYLSQEPEVVPAESVRQMLARRTGVSGAEEELSCSADDLADGADGAEERYGVALERYLSLGAADFEARAAEVTAEVGLSGDLLELPTSSLSGGQRAKASLAALLLSRFDLLLLDEPTNDLDFDGLGRLEAFVQDRPGGVVIVSHDRAFLERTARSILELDEASRSATLYAGGFRAYVEARETARRHALEAYESYIYERDRLRSRERQQRQWAVQGVRHEVKRPRDNDKAQRDFRINRTEKQAAKVRITEKALERLEVAEKPYEPWQLNLDLAAVGRSGEVVARLDQAVVRRGGWQLGPLDLEVPWAERLVILGPNGSGKTTLLQALLGRLALDGGRALTGPGVVVGELGQRRARFAGDASLIDSFLSASSLTLSESRSLLAKFGLGAGDVGRPAASLSPGERTRAELALLMALGTNCLVLDEPTNHLDLPAIEQLEQALAAWKGTLLLVTHDRSLLESIRLTRELRLEKGQLVSDLPV